MAKIYERLQSKNIQREKRKGFFNPQRVNLVGEDGMCMVNLLVISETIVFLSFFFLLHD